jgi:23S rRNA pseudoU1915 N3-methylase RlmH
MVSIIIISDSYAHFREPIEEYVRRLKGIADIKILKSEKSENAIFIRQKESQRIMELLVRQK